MKLPKWLIEKRDDLADGWLCIALAERNSVCHNVWAEGFNAAAELLLESNEFVRNTNKLSLWNNLTLVKKLVIATEALNDIKDCPHDSCCNWNKTSKTCDCHRSDADKALAKINGKDKT